MLSDGASQHRSLNGRQDRARNRAARDFNHPRRSAGVKSVHAKGRREIQHGIARLEQHPQQQIDQLVRAGACQQIFLRHAGKGSQSGAQRAASGSG
jgi:hypothetical protein